MSAAGDLFEEYKGQIVPRTFSAGYVALSYLVSLVGAASTLELINRRTARHGLLNQLLLLSSAVTMGGIAIWCMVSPRAAYPLCFLFLVSSFTFRVETTPCTD